MKPESQRQKNDVWNRRKLKSMGSLGALGFFMLFQYQNCAPASGTRSANAVQNSGVMTTIDNVNLSTDVEFTQSKVQLPPSDQPTVLNGACSKDQSGAVLGWKVHDTAGKEMQSGFSVCQAGQFQVAMAAANELDCDQAYEVTAQLSTGSAGHIEVSRDCSTAPNQIASEVSIDSGDSQAH